MKERNFFRGGRIQRKQPMRGEKCVGLEREGATFQKQTLVRNRAIPVSFLVLMLFALDHIHRQLTCDLLGHLCQYF